VQSLNRRGKRFMGQLAELSAHEPIKLNYRWWYRGSEKAFIEVCCGGINKDYR